MQSCCDLSVDTMLTRVLVFHQRRKNIIQRYCSMANINTVDETHMETDTVSNHNCLFSSTSTVTLLANLRAPLTIGESMCLPFNGRAKMYMSLQSAVDKIGKLCCCVVGIWDVPALQQ